MGLENAQYIAQLDENNPLGSDTRRQGDDHLRMIKGVLQKTFPNFDSALTAKPTDLNDIMTNNRGAQAGMITMYWGSEDDLPEGWVLCNGTKGTPDMRDRFIMCAGSDNPAGSIGGSNDVKVDFATEQRVLVESQMPAHSHKVNVDHKDNTGSNNTGGQRVGEQGNSPYAIDIQSTSVGGDKGHKHDVKIDSENANMPAYLSILFIMKVS